MCLIDYFIWHDRLNIKTICIHALALHKDNDNDHNTINTTNMGAKIC